MQVRCRKRFAVGLTVAGLVGCLFVGGCASGRLIPGSPRPPIRTPAYAFGFYNASSDQTLTDVKAEWHTGGILCAAEAGFLPTDPEHHGMGAIDEEQPDPIPARVTLAWRGPDGVAHTRVVEVAEKVPDLRGFTGTIYFKYTGQGPDEGWWVIPLSKADEDRLAEQGKPIIPPDPRGSTTAPATRRSE